MWNLQLPILLLASISLSNQTSNKKSMIVKHFNLKNVNSIVYITCAEEDSLNTFETVQNLVQEGFSVGVFKEKDTNNFTLPHRTRNLGILIESSCPIFYDILRKSETNHYFSVTYFWLVIAKSINRTFDAFSSVFISPCSQISIAHPGVGEMSSTYEIITLYKITPDHPLKAEASNYQEPLSSNRRNLEGIYLKSGIVIVYPDVFTTLDDLNMRHIDTIAHMNYPIMVNLRDDLNFQFDLMQVDNFGWKRNDTFDGLMGYFQRLEVDLGAAAVFMRLDRIAILDYAAETIKLRARILFRQPPLSAVTNIFAMPFAAEVWWSIFFFVIITVLAMSVQLWHPYYPIDMTYMDCINFVWGALCQQGFYVPIVARSGRMLVLSTFITSVFLFTSFSANIVALLQSPSETIKTLHDLTMSPLELGVQDTVYNKVFFKESSDPVTKFLYMKKISPKGEGVFMRPDVGIKRVRTQMFAYQVESQAAYKIISDTYNEPEKCGLKELELFQLPVMSIPLRKNFPYKELFRQRLRWQREVGLMKREATRWLPSKPKCENKFAGFLSVGIAECRYTFKMFGLGMMISFLIFLVEWAYYNCLKKFGQYDLAKHYS